MSTPFSRRKTNGAFGSTRIRPIGYQYEVLMSEELQAQGAATGTENPSRPNLANIFLSFSQPVTSQAKGNHTALQGAFNVAQLLWNAFVEGDKAVATARERLLALPDATAEGIDELIKSMRERYDAVNGGVNLLIRAYDLNFTKHGINLSIKTAPGSNIQGVQKTDALKSIQ
ncbi:MAG: hypothetical protein K6B46_01830 [Opitutales bacterium]|nr:hypothetical protein [Opitutales bacterium]